MAEEMRNLTWLAKQLGVSTARVSKLVRDPEWRWGRADWSDGEVAAIQAWLKDRRAMNNATAAEMGAELEGDPAEVFARMGIERRAKLQVMIERAAKMKVERELLLGGYVKKDDVERERVERIAAVKASMFALPARAALLAGKDEGEIAATLRDWMVEVCNAFAGETHG